MLNYGTMIELNLPLDFSNRMEQTLGKQRFLKFLHALQEESPVSVRLNPAKTIHPIPGSTSIPWAKNGYYLPERPSFTLDPAFHAGGYYVQEASSMFLDHILRSLRVPTSGIFLDMSAAPGGKSTLLSSYLGLDGFLVANEVIKNRAQILKENCIKWGMGNTLVTNNDPEHFRQLEGFFDVVLVDAPCSGEGMFRKDPQSAQEWSCEHVDLCASRQKRIMDATASLVSAGGYLIYSTCTYNSQENEDIIRFITEEFSYNPVRIPLQSEWGIEEIGIESSDNTYFGYQFFPHQIRGEGFFICVLQRPDDAYTSTSKRMKDFKHSHLKQAATSDVQLLQSLISLPEDGVYYVLQDAYFLLPKKHQVNFEYLSKYLNIKYFGIELGKIHKNQWIPCHEWALSYLPKDGFQAVELTLSEALDFLRKEDLPLENCPEGWVLMQYQGLSLGLLKNLGNRTNNYYPKEWRIKNL